MKTIPIRIENPSYNTKNVIGNLLQYSPNKPITLDNMRIRDRIQKKLDAAEDFLVVEDNEWLILSECTKSFPWSVYHADLLQVLEDIEGLISYNGKTQEDRS